MKDRCSGCRPLGSSLGPWVKNRIAWPLSFPICKMGLISVISSVVVSFHVAHSKPQTNICYYNELVLLSLVAPKMKAKGHISAWDPFESIGHPETPPCGHLLLFLSDSGGEKRGAAEPRSRSATAPPLRPCACAGVSQCELWAHQPDPARTAPGRVPEHAARALPTPSRHLESWIRPCGRHGSWEWIWALLVP